MHVLYENSDTISVEETKNSLKQCFILTKIELFALIQ